MVNLGQTNGLRKAAFFHHPPEAIDLVVFGVNVSMFVRGGSYVHARAYTLCICVKVSPVKI